MIGINRLLENIKMMGLDDILIFQGLNMLVQTTVKAFCARGNSQEKDVEHGRQSCEKEKDRSWQSDEKKKDRSWQSDEKEKDRSWQSDEKEKDRKWQSREQMLKRYWEEVIRASNRIIKNFPLEDELEVLALCSDCELENNVIKSCKLKFTSLENGMEILPCHFITAYNGTSQLISDFNYNISSFLSRYYGTNQRNAVLSRIGAWRNGTEATDNKIRNIHAIFSYLPMMICIPYFTSGSQELCFKIWMWNLFSDDHLFPDGIECCRIRLYRLKQHLLYEESLKWKNILERSGNIRISQQMMDNIKIVEAIQGNKWTSEQEESLLSKLSIAEEVKDIERKIATIISEISYCVVGMFADAYHYLHYSTPPKLPSLLSEIESSKYIFENIHNFYLELLSISEDISPLTRFQFCLQLRDFCYLNNQMSHAEALTKMASQVLLSCPENQHPELRRQLFSALNHKQINKEM